MADTETVDPPLNHTAPPGHSRAGHRQFGWCSRCRGREVWEELVAWRARDNNTVDGVSGVPDRVVPPSKEVERG